MPVNIERSGRLGIGLHPLLTQVCRPALAGLPQAQFAELSAQTAHLRNPIQPQELSELPWRFTPQLLHGLDAAQPHESHQHQHLHRTRVAPEPIEMTLHTFRADRWRSAPAARTALRRKAHPGTAPSAPVRRATCPGRPAPAHRSACTPCPSLPRRRHPVRCARICPHPLPPAAHTADRLRSLCPAYRAARPVRRTTVHAHQIADWGRAPRNKR